MFKTTLRLISLVAILAIVAYSCNTSTEQSSDSSRPNNPWVFRSVLDSIPRVVTFALNTNLWVAYSAESGVLYKAWKGSVNFDGPVYTTSHGPQPTSIGDAWLHNDHAQPWLIIQNGKETTPKKIQYKGHRYEGKHAHLKYNLILENGETISITEQPEYVTSSSGSTGFERTFTTSGVPSGVEVVLNINLSSIALQSSITVENGKYSVTKASKRNDKQLETKDFDGKLALASNGKTVMTTYFVKTPMIDHPKKEIINTADEETDPGYILIATNGCKTCHNTYRQTIGPAYIDIAKRYTNNSENLNTLIAKVKAGGSGNWGETAMNAHPEIADADIRTIVGYILSLDAEEEARLAKEVVQVLDIKAVVVDEKALEAGVLTKFFQSSKPVGKLADFNWKGQPQFESVLGTIEAKQSQVKWSEGNYGFSFDGYWKISTAGEYVLRLLSDDGSKLWLNDKMIIDNDGLHGTDGPQIVLNMEAGYHKIRTEFFQGLGGMALRLEIKKPNENKFANIFPDDIFHHKTEQPRNESIPSLPISSKEIPGDKFALNSTHPSYTLMQARPDIFTPKVGGMDFLSDGRMVLSTWDPNGSVYILDNVETGDPSKITVKLIGSGLAEPLGLKVVNDEIYILQKQELTKLIDHNGDELIDEYETISNAWKVSANFHEFAFGLAYKEDNSGKGYFYGTLATAIEAGGASSSPQIQDRGKIFKISKENGTLKFLGHGLRTPNGIGIGVDNEIFVADNQGDWLPACKIIHIKENSYDWFGSRSVDPVGTAALKEKKPVVWLPQDEIGNSPSQMSVISEGVYKGQMIHGEVTHGGIKRVFVEKVNGEYQGTVFRFIQGLEAGINRLCWGPDGGLYVGGIGSTGNWGQEGKLYYGLQRLEYNKASTFEMLAVRAKSNGLEIEFTEPLKEGDGWNTKDFEVKRWWYEPTINYGGPKMDETELNVLSATVSKDRKKVFLELDGLKENHVFYVHLKNHFISALEHQLWTTESWYTMNSVPANQLGSITEKPNFPANQLTASEQKAGWVSLFDGKNIAKDWHLFNNKNETGCWTIQDDALFFAPTDGKRGDIVSNKEYKNYILELEWKIQDCGNSGIFYNVVEDGKQGATYFTGPEMQVLDNACHPDARYPMHRAGDLYDMISCKYETVNAGGQWNKARLKIDNGKVEHWLNGHKLVEFEMWTAEWDRLVKGSKFAREGMKDFGTAKKGHIALQDHGDKVWFRNIKIKELK